LIRNARLDDVEIIRELINEYAEQEIMLFRSLADLYDSLRDFKLYESEGQVVGCCALNIVWEDLAEVKSLAVAPGHQGKGIGRALLQAVVDEARELHLPKIFTLTLEAPFFAKAGFELVEMDSLPHKVWSECVHCPKQDKCDEIAMTLTLHNRK